MRKTAGKSAQINLELGRVFATIIDRSYAGPASAASPTDQQRLGAMADVAGVCHAVRLLHVRALQVVTETVTDRRV